MILPPVPASPVDGTADEICLVLLSGNARIIAGDLDTGMLQGRASVFDKVAPQAVYVPMNTGWRVEAGRDAEIAVCRAPWNGWNAATAPDQC
jgi:5-deoxy-glucuronate isomerase